MMSTRVQNTVVAGPGCDPRSWRKGGVSMDLDALIFLSGKIGRITLLSRGIQFSLKTRAGAFSIYMVDIPCFGVRPEAKIWLIGRPRTYYHQRRGSHRVVVDALSLVPVKEEGGGDKQDIYRRLQFRIPHPDRLRPD